jgi:hypothetical protein
VRNTLSSLSADHFDILRLRETVKELSYTKYLIFSFRGSVQNGSINNVAPILPALLDFVRDNMTYVG